MWRRAENCGVSAVAVHLWSLTSLSGDVFTLFPYTAQFLFLSGTFFASVFGFGFQVFLRE